MVHSLMRVVSEDDQVLHQLQCGSGRWSSFEKVFGGYLVALSRTFSVKRRASEADREDALQETYAYVLDERRPRYAPGRASAKTYLQYAVQTAFNVVLNRSRRRESLELDVPAEDGVPEAVVADALVVAPAPSEHEERQFVDYVFKGLDHTDRQLFEEVANDRSIQDLSFERGVSRPTMSRTVGRIRERLQVRALNALSA